jgi:hypothetical protein
LYDSRNDEVFHRLGFCRHWALIPICQIEGAQPIPMQPLGDGWFEVEAPCGAGVRYCYARERAARARSGLPGAGRSTTFGTVTQTQCDDGSSYNSFQMNKQTIINGTDANGRDTNGMVTPMGKQRIYTGPMFEGDQH